MTVSGSINDAKTSDLAKRVVTTGKSATDDATTSSLLGFDTTWVNR